MSRKQKVEYVQLSQNVHKLLDAGQNKEALKIFLKGITFTASKRISTKTLKVAYLRDTQLHTDGMEESA